MAAAVYRLLSRYAPIVMLPVAAVVGFIGYNIESRFYHNRDQPYLESVQEKREKRLMEISIANEDDFSTLKEKKFVPKTIFEKNISPTLLDDDNEKQN